MSARSGVQPWRVQYSRRPVSIPKRRERNWRTVTAPDWTQWGRTQWGRDPMGTQWGRASFRPNGDGPNGDDPMGTGLILTAIPSRPRIRVARNSTLFLPPNLLIPFKPRSPQPPGLWGRSSFLHKNIVQTRLPLEPVFNYLGQILVEK